MITWIDGRLEKDAKVPLLSHSLHYGSAIFEGMRFQLTEKGPAIFRGEDHLKRFFHSAAALSLTLAYSASDLKEAIRQTTQANDLLSGYIRPLAFFGDGDMEIHPTQASLHVSISVWPWPARFGSDPIKVTLSSFLRTPQNSSIITAKISGHYGNSILARQEARRKGFTEALLLDADGHITEGSGANFFAVKNAKLYTPLEKNIFPGITRNTVIKIAQDQGIDVIVKDLKLQDLETFDEAFFTGTAVGIVPIACIDNIAFKHPFGPLTKKLKETYSLITHGKEKRYDHWLYYL